jgi:hypothetical protein
MSRWIVLALPMAVIAGCMPTAQQQDAAMAPTREATAERTIQTRRFDTKDRTLMLRATIGVLQDLGYTIEESRDEFGMIVASRLAGARIRAQVVVRAVPGASAITVRANFQRVGFVSGATLARGDTIADPEIYRGFFDKLAQSAFLTAHEI